MGAGPASHRFTHCALKRGSPVDHEVINRKLSDSIGVQTHVVSFDRQHISALVGSVRIVIEWDARDSSIYSYLEASDEPRFEGMKLQTWVLLRLLNYMDDDEELIPNKYPGDIDREVKNVGLVVKKLFINEPTRIEEAYYFCLGYATGKMDCLDGRPGW